MSPRHVVQMQCHMGALGRVTIRLALLLVLTRNVEVFLYNQFFLKEEWLAVALH